MTGHLLARTAAAMAAHGWHVLPTAGKIPRTEHGVLDATTDPAVIRQWWSRWPDAGIGVACGPSGLLVVDLDGPDGTGAWRELSAEHGVVPTRTARTGRGWHLYYRQDADGESAADGEATTRGIGANADQAAAVPVGNSAGRLAPGIDTRGHGGYVVAPPSPHPDRAAGYTWHVPRGATAPLPVVEAPGWLIEQLTSRHATPAEDAVRAAAAGTVNDRYLRAAIEGEARRVAAAAQGRRNHTLNAAAYALAGLGVPDDVIRARLADAARTAGLDPVETDRTLASGIAAGARNPRPPSVRSDPPTPRPPVTPGRGRGYSADAGTARVTEPAPDVRRPYVGVGAAGARDSAQIDREEADVLAVDDPRRVELLASAGRWDTQADAANDDAGQPQAVTPAGQPAATVEARQAPVGSDVAGALKHSVWVKPGAAEVAQIHAAARVAARSRREGTAATPPGSSQPASTDAAVDADGAGHPHVHADASTAWRPDLARAAVDRGSVADWLDTRHPAASATGSWSAVGTTGDHDSVVSGL